MEREKVMLAAHIDKDSRLHRAIVKEQEETGQTVAAIIRDALARRYRFKAGGNGKEAK